MSKNKAIKKYLLIGSLIILLGALAVFSYSILYNGGIVLKKTNSIDVMNKLKDIHGKDGKFELTQKDIDELSNLLLKPKTEGNLAFAGVNIEISNNELLIEAPVTYKGYKKVNLLFSSKGKLNFSDGKITYAPDNFKIGKVILPKKLVMAQVLKLNNEKVYAEDNLIKIDPSVTPFKINSFKIEDDKIIGTATTQAVIAPLKNNAKKQQLANETVKNSENSVVDASKDLSKNASKITQKQTETKINSLKKVQDDLSDAYDEVDTSKEQQVISKMQSAVSKMEANPSYDATKDQASVKSSYNTLDNDSQDRVKVALFTNVDQDNLGQLKQAFGL